MKEPLIKFKCYDIPDNLEKYQLAIDAAFAAGRAYGQSETKFELEKANKNVNIDYQILFNFSQENFVDYSNLCRTVEKATGGSRFIFIKQ